jgi:subtilase family serine protease
MGPENGDPEIACQSQLGGVITTGGGFSTFSRTPNWQKDAVNAYFDALTSSNTPTAGYNRHGRGYPDVSLIGVAYQVVLQGSTAYLYGTSASAPVFAAMISIINAARARSNLTSVGFVNPALYHSSRKKFRDITEGHNRCIVYADTSHPQGATCCNSGFHATKGWDPLTGLGSITLNALKDVSGTATDDDGATDDDSSDTSKTLSIGGIVGIVIGGVSFLVMVVSGTVWIVMGCRACCKSSVAASA